jgi:signal transduction histidine kinase
VSDAPGSDPGREGLRKLIGHDLRSPLAVVLGQCEILGLEVHGPLNERQLAAVRSIESQVERMLTLLDEARHRLAEQRRQDG